MLKILLNFIHCFLFVCLKGTDNSGSLANNKAGGSNAPQCWLQLHIKQEKEEEEEQSISQRGELLDFTNQDSVKSEAPDSPSASTDKQVSVHDFMVKAVS